MQRSKAGFGIFLVIAGIIALLINAGYISWSIFNSLFLLWPLLLVAAGIGMMFKDNIIIKGIAWLIVFAAIIGYAYISDKGETFFERVPNLKDTIAKDRIVVEKPTQTDEALLRIDTGAGNLYLSSTSANLIESDIKKREIRHKVDYSEDKKRANIIFERQEKFYNYRKGLSEDIHRLNDSVKWEIALNLGASKSDIDLGQLQVDKLELNCGASEVAIKFGSKSKHASAVINSGVSKINIEVPSGVGLRLSNKGALNNIEFSGIDADKADGVYQTPGYEEASCKIDIELNMALGSVNVNGY